MLAIVLAVVAIWLLAKLPDCGIVLDLAFVALMFALSVFIAVRLLMFVVFAGSAKHVYMHYFLTLTDTLHLTS